MLAGQLPTALELSQGLVPGGYGKRTSSSSTTTTEVGVMRLDGIAITLGRQYKISTSPLNMGSSVANDLMNAHIRINTAGVATTSSTQLTGLVESAFSSGGAARTEGLQVTYTPLATGTLSVLLSVSRDSGTGNVSINGVATYPIELIVEDIGASQASSSISL